MKPIAAVFNEALLALNNSDTNKAEKGFRQVVQLDPSHVPALNLLVVVLVSMQRFAEAEPFIARAVTLNQSSDVSFYNYGLIAKHLNKPQLAYEQFSKAAKLNPNVPETWNNRGTVCNDLHKYDLALLDFARAIELNPNYADCYANQGKSLCQLRRHEDSLAAYDKALSIKPDLAEAWVGRGHVFADLKRHDEAFAAYNKALSIRRDLAEALVGRGNVLADLKRRDEAIAAYDKALSVKPGLAEAWVGRGNVLTDLKRSDEAIAAYDKALSIKSDLAEAWLGRGNVFYNLKRHDESLAAYDRALSIRSDLTGAWLGRGNIFADLRRHDEALAAYDQARSIKPELEGAWLGRGNVFGDLKCYDEALAAYDKALSLNPDLEGAWLGRGNVFGATERYEESFAAYDKAFALEPDLVGAEGARLHSKMLLCKWDNTSEDIEHLVRSVKTGKANSNPFNLLPLLDSPEDQKQCADTWIKTFVHPPSNRSVDVGSHRNDKIRIGYFSSDFRLHPVGYLIAGLFEAHDRSRFETYGFSIGPDDNSVLRARIGKALDNFIDLSSQTDDEIVRRIKDSKIDILVDLMGHTEGARLAVLAHRPAPILVHYLGFAGTIGGNLLDYILVDKTIVPADSVRHFSEKIVYLPDSFMPHDDKRRVISSQSLSRRQQELPEDEFVFCCFNNSYKINASTFQSWANVLTDVEGSVLWLSDHQDVAKNNLRNEAEKRGISPNRLVFAKRLSSSADHLARHRLADLFLDTLPYNAHTTANDALWAGLPVVTQAGKTFAGRVAASLLNAIDLPELITHSREQYEALAIELALNRGKLQNIKSQLNANRLTTPLFDTARLARHLEAAYQEMYQRYRAGLPPDHIEIQRT